VVAFLETSKEGAALLGAALRHKNASRVGFRYRHGNLLGQSP
jgi:hypothetical protein